MKIRKGDTVLVTAGKDKGKTGQVLRVLENTNRVVVSDVNMRTRHVRSTPQRAGEIVKYEASIHRSNVMVVDPKTKKATRVGFKMEKGHKVRIAKKSGEVISGTATAKAAKTKTATDAAPKKEAKKKEKAAPEKKPFWKNMGFGAEALEGAEQGEGTHMHEDHSVPDSQKRQSNRSHQRGS